ncbi:MAG: amidohydrolase family protein [Candidatus Dormibacteraceae bacterium]
MEDSLPPALIDAHHHLWDATTFSFHGYAPSPSHYLLDEYLADAAATNLVRSVHVQAEVAREESVAETHWLQGIADEHGFPHGIVAYANLCQPDLESTLEEHAQARNLRGIRQILNWDRDPKVSQCERSDYLTDPAWNAGYAQLRHFGLSFDLQVFPNQMLDAVQVAGAHPDTPMIVNHAGMPRLHDPEGWEDWCRGMRALAERPNVSVKLSGFGMFDSQWASSTVRPYVLTAIELFGVERTMFASNYPVDKSARPFGHMFRAYSDLVADFSAAERRALFYSNALRIYRLEAG